jgi:hypothetical protein
MSETRIPKLAICAAAALATVVGCSSTSNHALIAKPALHADDLLTEPTAFEEVGHVQGRACRFFVVALIPFGNSTVGRAMEKALDGTGGDAVLNASVTTSLYGFVPIYNVLAFTCTTVQGIGVRFVRPHESRRSVEPVDRLSPVGAEDSGAP